MYYATCDNRNALKALRVMSGATSKEMVKVVRELYPKYDKTLQSKCERDEYGIQIKPDAYVALKEAFVGAAKSGKKVTRHGKHRLTSRIYARLTKSDFERLQLQMERDGYATVQDCVTAMVKRYLWEGEHNGDNP